MLKCYVRGNVMQTLKKNEVEFISKFGVCMLSSPSGSDSGDDRWCPQLALGSLFKVTSGPQSGCLLQAWLCLGWSSPLCPAGLLLAPGPGVGHVVSSSTTGHLPLEGASGVMGRVGSLDLPWEVLFNLQGRLWVCSPAPVPHILVYPRFFPILIYSFWCFIWGASLCKRPSSFLLVTDGSSV